MEGTSHHGRPGAVWAALLVVGLLLVSVLLVLPWIDVLAGNVVPVLQALTQVWLLAAVALIVLALLTRRRVVALGIVPALIAGGAATWLLTRHPEVPVKTRTAASAGHRQLTVLTLNAEVGGASVADIMNVVRQRHPDVVVFVEMTAAKLAALDAAGLRQVAPHRTDGMKDDGARGSVVLSRFPVTTIDPDTRLGPHDLQCPVARVDAPGAQVVVRAVHAYPPLRDGVASWRPQLESLGRWQRSQRSAHLVMTGDFNASVAHPAFRQASDGLLDAYPALHGSFTGSWPQHAAIWPFTQIDHMLTRGFVPQAAGIVEIGHTDHAAVWSTLRY